MSAASTLSRLSTEQLVMVVRAPSAASAHVAIAAAIAGGVRVIEVTYTVPDTVSVIRDLAANADLVVGAGTVRTRAQAEAALNAGAEFLVSPGLDDELVSYAVARDVLMLPGVFTPTEVLRALKLGALAVKLFPADLAGPAHLRALRGPLPDLQVIPSGGVSAGNAREWLDAGALAVGMAGSLSPAVALPDAPAITAAARRALAALVAPHTKNLPKGDTL